ncbi:hypothetical protein VTI28DRAFT_8167 [Corynascus sepedonium]
MAVRMSAARLPWDRVNSWMLMTAFEIVGAGLVPASQDATDHAANAAQGQNVLLDVMYGCVEQIRDWLPKFGHKTSTSCMVA